MIAIGVFLVVFALLWLADTPASERARRRLSWLIWLVPLLLLAGNRFNGADWINYKRSFDTLAGVGSPIDAMVDSPLEWLFSLLLWAVGQAGLPYEAVVVVIGVFNTAALLYILRGIQVECRGKTMALLLLVEGWTLYHEQLRQSVAVTLCLLALMAVLKHRWLSALLLWFAATGFHSSAVVAPLLLLLAQQTRRSGNQPMSLSRVIIIGVAAFAVISSLLALVRQGMLPFAGLDRLQTKLQLYEEHDVFGGTLFTAGLLAYALGFVVLMSVRKTVAQRREFWLSMCWTAAILWSVLGPLLRTQAILIRFEHYLLIFVPLAFGLLLTHASKVGWRQRLTTVVLCVFAATFPMRVFLSPENVVWTLNYQNMLLYSVLDLELEDETLRETLICANLALFDNDFCGRDPTGF